MTEPIPFLFGVDVEEPEVTGSRSAASLADLVDIYLDLLAEVGGRGTFFIVGEIARRYPRMVERVASQGHEIACHSDLHIPLDRLRPEQFRSDLRRNLAALRAAGAGNVIGYRAPSFSLIAQTRWAYKILAEEGIVYSSSVLPARNPHFGWPDFGRAPRVIDGVLELPISLLAWSMLPVPAAGGVYFRILPWIVVKHSLSRLRERGEPVLGYFHPYDVDPGQSYGAFPGFARWSVANWILFLNRGATLARLRKLATQGFTFETYASRLPSRNELSGGLCQSKCASHGDSSACQRRVAVGPQGPPPTPNF